VLVCAPDGTGGADEDAGRTPRYTLSGSEGALGWQALLAALADPAQPDVEGEQKTQGVGP
jgi:hypothetical protein